MSSSGRLVRPQSSRSSPLATPRDRLLPTRSERCVSGRQSVALTAAGHLPQQTGRPSQDRAPDPWYAFHSPGENICRPPGTCRYRPVGPHRQPGVLLSFDPRVCCTDIDTWTGHIPGAGAPALRSPGAAFPQAPWPPSNSCSERRPVRHIGRARSSCRAWLACPESWSSYDQKAGKESA